MSFRHPPKGSGIFLLSLVSLSAFLLGLAVWLFSSSAIYGIAAYGLSLAFAATVAVVLFQEKEEEAKRLRLSRFRKGWRKK